MTVYEPDEKTKLLGPAALNTIYVLDGDILGVPPSGMDNVKAVKEAREKGVSTGITYLDAVAALAAAKIEVEAARDTPKDLELRIRIAKLPSDVNVEISDVANRYITGKQKKVVVKGPTFIGVKARFLRP